MSAYILEVKMQDGRTYILGLLAESRTAAEAAVKVSYGEAIVNSDWVAYGFNTGILALTERPRLICYKVE